METNKDEAKRCLSIAKNHYGLGNYSSAVKLTKKSLSLFPTDEASTFLEKAERALANAPTSSEKPASTPSSSSNAEPTSKKYTDNQVHAVKTILACGSDYYKVLSLDKKCTEVEIKKSYRKLALQFHPDKNSAPGADEAFKLISKAFTVLSDPQKRAVHDAGGGDPEQRGRGGGGFSGFQGFSSSGGFEQEISPEDLFNMFFGGGASGSPFGGSPFPGFSSATFVGPGFRTQTFHTGGAGRRHPFQQPRPQQDGRNNSWWAILLQLLPLLVLFGYSVLSGLMTDNSPPFSFQPSPAYSQQRVTKEHHVPYYVNPSNFRNTDQNHRKLAQFEQQVVTDWVRVLQQSCQSERKERSSMIRSASGVFGIGRDETKYQQALSWPTRSCDELSRIGRKSKF
ncbi:DnaJ-domain-containing protein [Hesseltinella vesiculosa]|uniref:DnaJ-domain-containing protein n=1 Tax=Hesseltinella vesiculosa TaxID=101127 RepID=A0A1X2GG07_9FUNG|nr:DnaJ-domain-containing protein [Hesseltinella vesiculosa]